MKNKFLFYGLSIIFFSCLVFASFGNVDSFYNQDNPFNITFQGGDNHTYFLQIPIYSYVENVTITSSPSSIIGLQNFLIRNDSKSWINAINKSFNPEWNKNSTYYDSTLNLNVWNYSNTSGAFYGSSINTSQFFAFWIKPNGYDTKSGYVWIDGSGVNWGKAIFYNNETNSIRFLAFNGSISLCNGTNFNISVPKGEWTHISFGINSSHCISYRNGILNITNTEGGKTRSSNNQASFGELADVLSWNSAHDVSITQWAEKREPFTQEEITRLYNFNYMFTSLYQSENNVVGSISENQTRYSLNTSLINNILSNNCNCINCSINGNDCFIPFTFYSDTSGILEVNLSNSSWTRFLNFSILREQTLQNFDVSDHNVTIDIYCPNQTKTIEITTVKQEEEFHCEWDTLKMSVSKSGSEYYRTLLTDWNISSNNITFYALDLNQDTAIQTILNINDLTGAYSDGYMRVKRIINETEIEVIEQDFDAEGKVTLYLQKNARYTLQVISSNGETRSIGYLIPEIAAEKTVTVPSIDYVPSHTLNKYVSWDWNESTETIAKLYYLDTQSLTSSLTFTVYNGTNTSLTLYSTTESNPTASIYIYSLPANTSYVACFEATHSSLGTIKDCHGETIKPSLPGFEGWDNDEELIIKQWIAGIFCVFICLLISSVFPSVGLAVFAFFTWMFVKWDWLTFGSPVKDYTIISLLTLVAVFTFILRGWKL